MRGDEELRPCPFCGGTGQTLKSSRRWGHFVSCQCTAAGPGSETRAEAVRAWNTRPDPAQMTIYDALGGVDDGGTDS